MDKYAKRNSSEILEGLRRNCFIYPTEVRPSLSLKSRIRCTLKKLTSFYINPIIRSQCCYNACTLEAVAFLIDYCEYLQNEIAHLQNNINKH